MLQLSDYAVHHKVSGRFFLSYTSLLYKAGTCLILLCVFRFDKGNRCIVSADSQTGNVIRAERQFIHNSKITSSALNEKKAFEKSRQRNKPQGRYIGIPQMLHQLLGYTEVHSTMKFEVIETTPFKYCSTTRSTNATSTKPAWKHHRPTIHSARRFPNALQQFPHPPTSSMAQ